MKIKRMMPLIAATALMASQAAMALPIMIEGAGGGGLNPWALIANGSSKHIVTPAVFGTFGTTPEYDLYSAGVNLSISKYAEVYYTHQYMGLPESMTATLDSGVKSGFLPTDVTNLNSVEQDIIGGKLQVYHGSGLIPAIAVGMNYHMTSAPLPLALTAHANGADYYVTGTGIYPLLGSHIVLNADLYITRSNYLGLLGQGGADHRSYSAQGGASVGYFVAKDVVVGAEWRSFPGNNLAAAQAYLATQMADPGVDMKQSDWYDGFIAYMPNPKFSVVAAILDLGNMANIPPDSNNANQNGFYVSMNAAF
ncbi:DUF3034 family protein [Acidiferrobacter sp.]|uniref:DUF3034 family protein n=1 Tax=Acidiferrobacter sp. TaxID=1872107 RepID=UPI00262322A8|nr:DUF3034 family protein [Acidiferrobacter sp.]